MTWIKDFLNHRSKCINCEAELTLGILGSKFRESKLIDNKIVTPLKLNSFGKKSTATLSMCSESLQFMVDFDNSNYVVKASLNNIKNIFGSEINPQIIKRCESCKGHKYHSTGFNFNWRNATITSSWAPIGSERLNIVDSNESVAYSIINYPYLDKTEIFYGRVPENMPPNELSSKMEELDLALLPSQLNLPHIELGRGNLIVDMLKTYIIFS